MSALPISTFYEGESIVLEDNDATSILYDSDDQEEYIEYETITDDTEEENLKSTSTKARNQDESDNDEGLLIDPLSNIPFPTLN